MAHQVLKFNFMSQEGYIHAMARNHGPKNKILTHYINVIISLDILILPSLASSRRIEFRICVSYTGTATPSAPGILELFLVKGS